ncbi:glutamate decarboxylase [Trichonephila clavipes]|nr:glutamate decarboxylase [Trichonephila clavipes]
MSDSNQTLQVRNPQSHPHFFNQLSSGLDVVGMAGEWLTATANTNMFTYEIAAVFILMEQVTLKKMRDIIGFTKGDSILGPGGSISNLYACLCARHKMYPSYKQKGLMGLGQLVIYTSEHSHYSMKGAGMVMGFGTDHVIEVKTDSRHRCKEQLPAPGNRSNERRDREKDLATTGEKKVGTGEKKGRRKKSRGREK